MIEEISATDLKRRLDAGDDIQLIDVRQPEEWAFARIEGAKLIPLGELMDRMVRSTRTARSSFTARRVSEAPGPSRHYSGPGSRVR